MYYSDLLKTSSKQEKSPVNKMYLSELKLKWKSFQEQIEAPGASNADLAEALSTYLGVIHNKKFVFNKSRGTGFHHTSALFSAYYLHDLISALLKRNSIVKEPGMSWGFNSFSYDFNLSGFSPQLSSLSPEIFKLQTPPVLSLTQKIDFQYRISGKRNFTKTEIVMPYLLFFAYKSPQTEHLFMIEHYARIAADISRAVKVFIVCETLEDCQKCEFGDLPISIFALRDQNHKTNTLQLSTEIIDKLDLAIKEALSPVEHMGIVKTVKINAPAQKPMPRKAMGRKPGRKPGSSTRKQTR